MKTEILEALESIRQAEGIVRPESVVEHARDPKSALHGEFTWDRDEAAHQYNLWQARQLLRVAVETRPNLAEPVRVFVSLPSDRRNPGGGYRLVDDVLRHDEMRAELVKAALADLNRTKERYKELRELAKVYAEIEAATERLAPGLRRKSAENSAAA